MYENIPWDHDGAHLPCRNCYGWHPRRLPCDRGPYSDLDAMTRQGHAHILSMYAGNAGKPGMLDPSDTPTILKHAATLVVAACLWAGIAYALGWHPW